MIRAIKNTSVVIKDKLTGLSERCNAQLCTDGKTRLVSPSRGYCFDSTGNCLDPYCRNLVIEKVDGNGEIFVGRR